MISKTPKIAAPQKKVRESTSLRIADMEATIIYSMILEAYINVQSLFFRAQNSLIPGLQNVDWLTGSCRQSRNALGRPQRCWQCCRAVLASSQAAPDTAVRANNLIRWLEVCCLATSAVCA